MGNNNNLSYAFVPNELIAVVEHPDNGSTPADIKDFVLTEIAELGNEINGFCTRRHEQSKYNRQPTTFKTPKEVKVERVVRLKRQDSDKHKNVAKCFSLVYLEFDNLSAQEIIEHAYVFYDFCKDKDNLPKRLCQIVRQSPQDDDSTTLPDKLRLTALLPHWLLTGTPNEPPAPPDLGGSGGPGRKPIAADSDPFTYGFLDPQAPWNFVLDSQPIANQQSHDKFQTALGQRDENGMVDHVKVIILDTAPPLKKPKFAFDAALAKDSSLHMPYSIEEAYAAWSDKHPLLKRLLAHDKNPTLSMTGNTVKLDRLTITYNPEFDEVEGAAPYNPDTDGFDMKRTRKVGDAVEEYPYFVMDHGLFIAGIIHTLAPSVPIHLIEVLNAYGYFSLEHLAWGLEKALAEADENTKIVVNLSLMLSLPRVDGHKSDTDSIMLPTGEALDFKVKFDPAGNLKTQAQNEEDREFAYYLSYALLNLSELVSITGTDNRIDHLGGILVAAAGNDGENGIHPIARYPAAFDNVYGVAALGSNQDFATYSNRGDHPPYNGFAAFGGDSNADFAENGTGMLGLYIGDFPDPTSSAPLPFKTKKNENGWGYWAGTSFATPVVTGCIAQLLAVDNNRTADDAIYILRTAIMEPEQLQEHHLGIRQVGLAGRGSPASVGGED